MPPDPAPIIRNRSRETLTLRAGDLLPNPANWRRHPAAQRSALAGLLEARVKQALPILRRLAQRKGLSPDALAGFIAGMTFVSYGVDATPEVMEDCLDLIAEIQEANR
jgi:hypothetical protein